MRERDSGVLRAERGGHAQAFPDAGRGARTAPKVRGTLRNEDRPVVKDKRLPEIAWLLVIAVLVALGGDTVLRFLGANRALGTILLGIAILGTVVMIRRAYDPASPTVRVDVTKAVAYCAAAVMALVTVDWHPHWAVRACLTAAEVAIVFEIFVIVSSQRAGSAQR